MQIQKRMLKQKRKTETRRKKFNAGKMIMEHISDAHEWHIMEIGETPVAIPLPCYSY